jgi:hypothetical protein
MLDDIIITGETEEVHIQRLEQVLHRLKERNLKVNKDKCQFFKDSVQYCGHIINKEGLHKMPEK